MDRYECLLRRLSSYAFAAAFHIKNIKIVEISYSKWYFLQCGVYVVCNSSQQ